MRRTRLKPISEKKRAQMVIERTLKATMLEECGNTCQYCGATRSLVILDKHEIVSRALGGDPTDKDNCIILCRFQCHAKATTGGITRQELREAKRRAQK